MPPSRAVALRRRMVAVGLTIAATAAIWALLLRGDGGGPAGSGAAQSADPRVRAVESRLGAAQMVDQVMLVGFGGTSAGGAIEHELRAHELGGVIVGASNWTDRSQGSKLVAGLRGAGLGGGRVPPLIVTHQEGGRFRSLGDMPPAVSELRVGQERSPAIAERWAQDAASALRGRRLRPRPVPGRRHDDAGQPAGRPGVRRRPRPRRRAHRGQCPRLREARSPARPSTSPVSEPRRRTPTRGPRRSGSTPRPWPAATRRRFGQRSMRVREPWSCRSPTTRPTIR